MNDPPRDLILRKLDFKELKDKNSGEIRRSQSLVPTYYHLKIDCVRMRYPISQIMDILLYDEMDYNENSSREQAKTLKGEKLCKEVMVQLSMKPADHMFCMTAFAAILDEDPDLYSILAEHHTAVIQATYVYSGCDYTSFFAGCGKSAFFNALYQYVDFITSRTVAPGILCGDDENNSLSAFYGLVRSVYFKKYLVSYTPTKSPYALYRSIALH